jgi:hypothetical protein
MKQIKFVSLAILMFASAAFAQNKLLTIDDIFSLDPKVRVNFSGTPGRFAWSADGKSFRSVRNGSLVRVDPLTGETTPYYDSAKFQSALEQAGISPTDATRIANSMALQFNDDETAILVSNKNDLWHYDVTSGVLKRLTNNQSSRRISARMGNGSVLCAATICLLSTPHAGANVS